MAAFVVQTTTRAGMTPTSNAAAELGDTFVNDGRTILRVTNGNVGTIVLTIVTSAEVDGLAVADRTVSFTTGAIRYIGPFATSTYGTTVSLTYDVHEDVLVEVLKVGS